MPHAVRPLPWLVLALICLMVAATPTAGQEAPDGTLAIETTSVAAGAGANWGEGTLTLNNGTRQRFSLKGLAVGSIGMSKVRAEGKVYNLKKIADLEGSYLAGEASITVGSGSGAITLRNEHGVVIYLKAAQQGAELTVAGQGVEIMLE